MSVGKAHCLNGLFALCGPGGEGGAEHQVIHLQPLVYDLTLTGERGERPIL